MAEQPEPAQEEQQPPADEQQDEQQAEEEPQASADQEQEPKAEEAEPEQEEKQQPSADQEQEQKEERKQEDVPADKKGLKRIVVGGATGAVGRHCVNLLVRDPRVGAVYTLSRSSNPKPADFYGLDEKTDDVGKIKHLAVDYSGDLDAQFNGLTFDAGISGIGVYTANVKNEADFKAQEYEPNMKLARAAAAHGAKRWSYLSGSGVKQTNEKAWNQPLFSWVKGCIEKDLQKVDGFEFVNAVRPGFIAGRPNSSGWLEDFANKFADSLCKTKMAVHRDTISAAMVYTLLNEELKGPFVCYENEDIKVAALAYTTDRKSMGNQEKPSDSKDETEKNPPANDKDNAANAQESDNKNDAQ